MTSIVYVFVHPLPKPSPPGEGAALPDAEIAVLPESSTFDIKMVMNRAPS